MTNSRPGAAVTCFGAHGKLALRRTLQEPDLAEPASAPVSPADRSFARSGGLWPDWASLRLRRRELQSLPTLPHFTLSVAGAREHSDHGRVRDAAGPMSEICVPEGSSCPPTELSRFPSAPGSARGRRSAGNTAARSPGDADKRLSHNAGNSDSSSLSSLDRTRRPGSPTDLMVAVPPAMKSPTRPNEQRAGRKRSSYSRVPSTVDAPHVRTRTPNL